MLGILVTHVGRWPRGKAAEAKFRLCSIRDRRFTLVNNEELYDLQSDPGETRNVIALHPEEVQKLRTAYDQWWDDVQKWWDDVQKFWENDQVIGPRINPFKERYWKQFGGGPTPDELEQMDPTNAND